MKNLVKAVVGLIMLMFASQGLAAQVRYMVVDLGTLGSDSGTIARAINNRGQIVGASCTGPDNIVHAYMYSGGSMIDLAPIGGDYSESESINALGQVVGMANTTDNKFSYAFLYSDGVTRKIGESIKPWSINDKGQIACAAYYVGYTHAARYWNGSIVDIGTLGGLNSEAYGINNAGQMVGISELKDPNIIHGFLYSDGVMKDLGTLGGDYSVAFNVNAAGHVAGYSTLKDQAAGHAFLYANGSMKDMGSLGNNSSVAYGINILDQVVGRVIVDPSQNLNHGFIWVDGVMSDLNDLIAPNADWTIEFAISINDAGQIVGYGRHGLNPQRAFLLNPIENVVEKISVQPSIPTYGVPPIKDKNKDCLVIVGHGWQPYPLAVDISWVDTMTNSIAHYFTANNINNWQIAAYKWPDNAWTVSPETALSNAEQEGLSLGRYIGQYGYKRVHCIVHSAGANLALGMMKNITILSPNTEIQCTYLDPYVGLGLQNKNKYGYGSEWSDCYLSYDFITGGELLPFTASRLKYAYTVDVSDLQRKIDPLAYVFTGTGVNEPCMRPVSPTHDWPIEFYQKTIDGSADWEYEGFGFPLSLEGGNWGGNNPDLKVDNNPIRVLGTKTEPCIEYFSSGGGGYDQMLIDIVGTPSADLGQVNKSASGLELKTQSPAWTLMSISVTNNINTMSFDARFTSSSGSKGLLTIYWNTNVIGTVDETAVQSELKTYTLGFPLAVSNSMNTLGFRLDPFSGVQSSIVITNISVLAVGVTKPFSLSITTNMIGNLPIFRFTGQSGYEYTVEASTNLADWETIALLVNTNGVVDFTDYGLTNHTCRFYRAVAPF